MSGRMQDPRSRGSESNPAVRGMRRTFEPPPRPATRSTRTSPDRRAGPGHRARPGRGRDRRRQDGPAVRWSWLAVIGGAAGGSTQPRWSTWAQAWSTAAVLVWPAGTWRTRRRTRMHPQPDRPAEPWPAPPSAPGSPGRRPRPAPGARGWPRPGPHGLLPSTSCGRPGRRCPSLELAGHLLRVGVHQPGHAAAAGAEPAPRSRQWPWTRCSVELTRSPGKLGSGAMSGADWYTGAGAPAWSRDMKPMTAAAGRG
jgi:hypothetical protein